MKRLSDVFSESEWRALQRHRGLLIVTALQALCSIAFVADLVSEFHLIWTHPAHPIAEGLTVVAMLAGMFLGLREIRSLVDQNEEMERRLRAFGSSFHDVLEQAFEGWALTASERDVALFMIKGMSIAEIATLRRTQAGTVKAQCAAIYRKAGVSGRAQLLSGIVDDLTAGSALGSEAGPEAPAASRPPAALALRPVLGRG